MIKCEAGELIISLMSSSHRRHGQDKTVLSCFVSGVNRIGDKNISKLFCSVSKCGEDNWKQSWLVAKSIHIADKTRRDKTKQSCLVLSLVWTKNISLKCDSESYSNQPNGKYSTKQKSFTGAQTRVYLYTYDLIKKEITSRLIKPTWAERCAYFKLLFGYQWLHMRFDRTGAFKVIYLCTNRKPTYDFMLVIILRPKLYLASFLDIAPQMKSETTPCLYFWVKIAWSYLQLFCHNTLALQTDNTLWQ